MSKKYDVLVAIGRFQPFHNAHLEILTKASDLADKVIVIVGSANKPRTYKNPFSKDERIAMIEEAIVKQFNKSEYMFAEQAEFVYDYTVDSPYNDQAWASRIQEIVSKHATKEHQKIGIIGHKKDNTSFYFDLFPQWDFEDVGQIEPLNATNIRELYFRKDCNMNFINNVVPKTTAEQLVAFKQTQTYNDIVAEREFIELYKKQYASLQYAPTFVTADAVVIQSGHVLLIKRKAFPGKGLWALPGGFLNADTDKSMQDCAIRELKEETGIKVPVPVLNGSIVASRVFDAIGRSERGRTITHAYKIMLADGVLPKVRGLDDAEHAVWIPIADIKSEEMYEDHFDIVNWGISA